MEGLLKASETNSVRMNLHRFMGDASDRLLASTAAPLQTLLLPALDIRQHMRSPSLLRDVGQASGMLIKA